jgi:hypothetical protein
MEGGDEEEDENAQDDFIARELEQGTFRLTARVVFRVHLHAVVFPDRSLLASSSSLVPSLRKSMAMIQICSLRTASTR